MEVMFKEMQEFTDLTFSQMCQEILELRQQLEIKDETHREQLKEWAEQRTALVLELSDYKEEVRRNGIEEGLKDIEIHKLQNELRAYKLAYLGSEV